MNSLTPENTVFLGDDSGRKVQIHHVGSLLHEDIGTVIQGPYQFPYSVRIKAQNRKPGMKEYREEHFTSKPQYEVKLDRWGRCFTFLEEHVKFIDA